jgi:hypothetical protein
MVAAVFSKWSLCFTPSPSGSTQEAGHTKGWGEGDFLDKLIIFKYLFRSVPLACDILFPRAEKGMQKSTTLSR